MVSVVNKFADIPVSITEYSFYEEDQLKLLKSTPFRNTPDKAKTISSFSGNQKEMRFRILH